MLELVLDVAREATEHIQGCVALNALSTGKYISFNFEADGDHVMVFVPSINLCITCMFRRP